MLVVLQQVMQGLIGMVIYTLSLLPLTAWLAQVAKPMEKYFVTDRNLRAELEDLEAAATMPASEFSPDLQVTDMNENKLAISIKNIDGLPTPPDSPPQSSPDVQQGTQEPKSPRLHGILKQRSRTLSESSDEVFTYSRENSVCLAGSESPISESEEGGDGEPGRRERKKSVSFSEKVDEQMYKQNQPTTSLRNTLKNKRKNQRKAEKKHQDKVERVNRRNRSSDSISEMSSDGEGSSTHDEVSSNHEEESGTGVQVKGTNNKTNSVNDNAIIADTNGNITPNEDTTHNDVLANRQQKNRKNKRKNRRNKKQEHKGDEVAQDAHQPQETSSQSSEYSEGEGRVDDTHNGECCDNVVPKKKLVEIVKDDGHDSDDDGEDGSPEDGERTKENGKSENILSCDDNKAAVDRAPCPVSFSNSVMFDLD